MGHMSRKEVRRRKAEKELRKRFSVGNTVRFWCPIYDEVVDGLLVGKDTYQVEIIYLGGGQHRNISDFSDSPVEDRNGWWLKT